MKHYLHFSIHFILMMAITFLFLNQQQHKKIGLVNSQKVIENYNGFKEAQDVFELKTEEMSKTFEKQKALFEVKEKSLENTRKQLSKNDMLLKENELKVLEAKTVQLGKAMEKKAKDHEQKLLKGIYNKVDDYIKRYAEQHDIDMITGITATGNVLYASDAINITQQIIDGLNKEYAHGISK